MFSHVFGTLGAKNTVNTNVLGGSEAQNHGIYDVFLPLVAKSTVFTVVFGQHLAKTLVFTDVSPYNKMSNLLNNQVTGLAALPFTS